VATLGAEEPSNAERIALIKARIREMEPLYLQWARSAKRRYRALNFATILFSSAVPTVVLVAPLLRIDEKSPVIASVAGILGAFATLAKSIDSLFKNHDTWLRNNESYGRLRSEQFLFGERAGIYRGLSVDDCVSTYAERIESIIGSEATSWSGAEKAPQGGEGG
jgi:hypothetical protein